MTGHSMYPHILVQWINFLGVVLLVGGIVSRAAVLNRSLEVFNPASSERIAIQAASGRYLKQLIGGCLILLVMVSTIDLVLRAQMMSGKPLSAVPAILPLVLLKTHLGNVWLGKMAVLSLFGILWFFLTENPSSGTQFFLILASAAFCLTMSLAGHPADKGDFSFSVLADWLHVMAISSWAGGLVPLRFLIPRLLTGLDDKARLKFETAVLHRFSRLAVICVGLLVLTGAYSGWVRLRTLSNLLTTPYGNALLRKLVFVVFVLGLGGLSRYYILPAFQRLEGQSPRDGFIGKMVNWGIRLLGGGSEEFGTLERRFKVFLAWECLLVLVVLGLTALLTQTSPPDLTNFTAPGSPSDMEHMM